MKKQSAGLVLYRPARKGFEVLVVHPGGPFWAKKDAGAWSFPKGEFAEGEEPLVAALREFQEEIGATPPAGRPESLGESKQPGGKLVYLFALAGDFSLEHFKSNMFKMEWPPKSGTQQEFPECDRAAWVSLATARKKLTKGQVVFVERLAEQLHTALGEGTDGPQQAALF